jgi:GNAT superfamily N-acetyltransferase
MSEYAKVAIRQATPGDLGQLCEARNNKRLFRGYLEECDGERAFFLVAEIDGAIVGFGLIYLDITKNGKKKSHLPKLSDLYVVDAHRRKGVATALLLARESIARERGHASIYASIDPVESSGMVAMARKHSYFPQQEQPYQVSAIFHDSQGRVYRKNYFRLDFRKSLL